MDERDALSSNRYKTCFGGPRMTVAEETWERLYSMSPREREELNARLQAIAAEYGPGGP